MTHDRTVSFPAGETPVAGGPNALSPPTAPDPPGSSRGDGLPPCRTTPEGDPGSSPLCLEGNRNDGIPADALRETGKPASTEASGQPGPGLPTERTGAVDPLSEALGGPGSRQAKEPANGVRGQGRLGAPRAALGPRLRRPRRSGVRSPPNAGPRERGPRKEVPPALPRAEPRVHESPWGWLEALGRERAYLQTERSAIEASRQALDERESLLEEHLRLAWAVEAALKRKHQALLAREHEVQRREAALEPNVPQLGRPGVSDLPAPPVGTGLPPPGAIVPVAETMTTAGPPPGTAVLRPAGRTILARRQRRAGDRLPSGTPRLDDLLLGGLHPRSHVALVGDAFVGKEVVLYRFIAEGLKQHEPAVLITTTRTSQEVSRALRTIMPEFDEHERAGRVSWIDASGAGIGDRPGRFAPVGSDDTPGLSEALVLAAKRSVDASATGRFRVGFLGLSAVLAHSRDRESHLALQNLLGVLRSHEALAMYSLEAGAVTESQVESLLGRMDGALLFRQERGRTLLAAKGFGGVATGDWVECRPTEKGLVLGSFALERIR